MSETEAVHKTPNYVAVFWSLFVLTVFEIIVANLHIFAKPVIVIMLVFLAAVKAALVALFYMHLKFEKFVIYIIVFFPLFLAAVLTLLVFLDKAPILSPL